jgi:hypothetical protein
MRRTTTLSVAVALLAVSAAIAEPQRGAGANPQLALQRDLDGMTARLGGGRVTQQDVIADSRRLAASYRSLVPVVYGFGPHDYEINRQVARLSLAWLGRVGSLYRTNPLVARAVMDTYDSIGGFYRDYGRFYRPGAFVAYAGATRLAQRLMLEGRDAHVYERDLERYALAYGTLATLNGYIVGPWTVPVDLPESVGVQPPAAPPLKPVELPAVDVGTLDAQQREAWNDVRDRFRSVASRVHLARTLLNDLASRLRAQQMTLHPQDAATAIKMQSFLEDAADLIRERRFDVATEALERAEYERMKLRSVTGQ